MNACYGEDDESEICSGEDECRHATEEDCKSRPSRQEILGKSRQSALTLYFSNKHNYNALVSFSFDVDPLLLVTCYLYLL